MNFDYFFSGVETQAYNYMGAHKCGNGVEFYLWAPHASKVELFSSKDDFKVFYNLEKIDNRGIWHLFIDNCECIYSYRYRIYHGDKCFDKSDPYAFYSELRPSSASVMYDLDMYKWSDDEYMFKRNFSYENALNIYEVHVNGFKKDYEFNSYRYLKETLIPYVKDMGYTHIELMPIVEHPFDGSWGYQATGLFSATSRYGTPYDLMDFINECHLNGIGVLLDVAYVHFAIDDYGLINFDGESCYEKGMSQWGSCLFDMSKGEVVSFLMSSANFFLNKYHFDGLRLDAISNLIYNDGNRDLGENSDGINFIKRLNYHLKKENPSVILIAEDSTDYSNVTVSTEYNGLGFDYKWDLGWMNDTLDYYGMDPIYRQYHHNQLTFSMAYFYSEKFILPFSHDEVVHSKKTIVDKMWGSYEDKFRQCRNLFIYMFTHPGKKLNFLGNDIAMFREFDETKELDWFMLKYPAHDSFKRFFRDLCQIYKAYKAFYAYDYDFNMFKWIDADNNKQSIYSYIRYDDENAFVVVLNMQPISYEEYRIGVPIKGKYIELINSEKDIYGGCNMCNFKPIKAEKVESHNLPYSINIRIAPYSGIVFKVDLKKENVTDYIPQSLFNKFNINVNNSLSGKAK